MTVCPEFVFEIFAVICIICFLPLRDLSAVVVDDVCQEVEVGAKKNTKHLTSIDMHICIMTGYICLLAEGCRKIELSNEYRGSLFHMKLWLKKKISHAWQFKIGNRNTRHAIQTSFALRL